MSEGMCVPASPCGLRWGDYCKNAHAGSIEGSLATTILDNTVLNSCLNGVFLRNNPDHKDTDLVVNESCQSFDLQHI